MYQGKPTEGKEFFNLLFESDEFNSELGKVALAAGRLESELILLFFRKKIKGDFKRKTLGGLVKIGKEKDLFDKNLIVALDRIRNQRNYLMHNIHALLIGSIPETILERSDLLNSDIVTYTERAWQLRENLIGIADIISEK